MADDEKRIEQNKPAFFQDEKKSKPDWRAEEYEGYKKLQEQTRMDFNPDQKTDEQLHDFFRLNKEKGAVDDMQ